MSNYVDISSFQPENIDYAQYLPWSRQGDGISRICLRVDQGVGVKDGLLEAHFNAAMNAHVDSIIYYHFCYPWLHKDYAGAQAEVNSFLGYLGHRLRSSDQVMCDDEDYVDPQGVRHVGPAAWYYDFAHILAGNASLSNNRVLVYSYLSYIQSNLQDPRLAQYPLVFARYGAGMHPPCPAPWSSYAALQYTSKGTVPGIPEAVDVDIYYAPVAPTPPPPPTPDIAGAKAQITAAQAALAVALGDLG